MQMQRESGRNASNRGWHVLHNSRSINHGRVVLGYKSQAGVSESINRLCLKREDGSNHQTFPHPDSFEVSSSEIQ